MFARASASASARAHALLRHRRGEASAPAGGDDRSVAGRVRRGRRRARRADSGPSARGRDLPDEARAPDAAPTRRAQEGTGPCPSPVSRQSMARAVLAPRRGLDPGVHGLVVRRLVLFASVSVDGRTMMRFLG